jgi:hypothetical protein
MNSNETELDRHRVRQKDELPEQVQGVYETIERFVNGGGIRNAMLLGEALATFPHRTLQQNFMRLVMSFLQTQAEKEPGFYDARNENTVRLAKAAIRAMAEEKLGLPII